MLDYLSITVKIIYNKKNKMIKNKIIKNNNTNFEIKESNKKSIQKLIMRKN